MKEAKEGRSRRAHLDLALPFLIRGQSIVAVQFGVVEVSNLSIGRWYDRRHPGTEKGRIDRSQSWEGKEVSSSF